MKIMIFILQYRNTALDIQTWILDMAILHSRPRNLPILYKGGFAKLQRKCLKALFPRIRNGCVVYKPLVYNRDHTAREGKKRK
jgi:hypothetical protein